MQAWRCRVATLAALTVTLRLGCLELRLPRWARPAGVVREDNACSEIACILAL